MISLQASHPEEAKPCLQSSPSYLTRRERQLKAFLDLGHSEHLSRVWILWYLARVGLLQSLSLPRNGKMVSWVSRQGESWYLSYLEITCHRLTPSWGHSEPPPSHTMGFISEVVPAPPSVYTFRYPIREALIPEPSRKASRSLNLQARSEPSATSAPCGIQGSVSCLPGGIRFPQSAGLWRKTVFVLLHAPELVRIPLCASKPSPVLVRC